MLSLTAQLDELENSQLVRRLPEDELAYLFKHALTQESAYESLLLKRRREIHRRVAEAFERLYPDQLEDLAAVLAAHYAKAGDDARTSTYATLAGDRAASISAYIEANAHFTAALESLSRLADTAQSRRERIDITIKQINVAWGIDSAELNLQRLFQAEALARSLPASDRLRLAHIHYWIARVYSYRNENRKATLYYEQVLAAARESEGEELFGLAAGLGGRTFFIQGFFGKAVPLLEQAIPHLERIGNWPEWILAQVSLAISLAAQGYPREARARGEEAVRKALELNDVTLIASARGMAARVEFMAGDLERMLAETQGVARQVEGVNPLVHYMVLGFQAWAEGRLGNHETARATMAAAMRIANQLGTRLIFADWFAAARAEIELYAGQIEEALRLAEGAAKEATAAGGIFAEGMNERVRGQALAVLNGSGDPQVEEHLEKSLKLFEEGDARIEAARILVTRGLLRLERGELKAAREDLEKAAAQFQISGLLNELEKVQRLVESLAARSRSDSSGA